MDRKAIYQILDSFCDNYLCCDCPLSKYKTAKGLSMCYYVCSRKLTDEQVQTFLGVARQNWNNTWTRKISKSAHELLNLKAKVI